MKKRSNKAPMTVLIVVTAFMAIRYQGVRHGPRPDLTFFDFFIYLICLFTVMVCTLMLMPPPQK